MVKKDKDDISKEKKSSTKSTTKKETTKTKTSTRKKKTEESLDTTIETPVKTKKTTKKSTKEPKNTETKVEKKTKKTATKKVDEDKEVVKKIRKSKTKEEPVQIIETEDPDIVYEVTNKPPIKKPSKSSNEKSLLLKPVHEPRTLLPKGYVPGSDYENIQKKMEANTSKKQGLLLTPVREPRTLLPKGYTPEKETPSKVETPTPPIHMEKSNKSVSAPAPKKMSIADMLRAPSPKASTAKQNKYISDTDKEEIKEVVKDVKPVASEAPKPVVKEEKPKEMSIREKIREAIKGCDTPFKDVATTDPIVYVGSVVDTKTGEYVSTFRKCILHTDSTDYIVDIAFAIHNVFNQFDTNTIANLITVKDITPSKFVIRI